MKLERIVKCLQEIFQNSEPKLGKLKEFNNYGMEVQVKRAFKRCPFLSPKNNTKEDSA